MSRQKGGTDVDFFVQENNDNKCFTSSNNLIK